MTDNKEVSYLRQRIIHERALTKSGACEKARAVHRKLSKLYEARLALSYLHEANAPHHLRRNRRVVDEPAPITLSRKKQRVPASLAPTADENSILVEAA